MCRNETKLLDYWQVKGEFAENLKPNLRRKEGAGWTIMMNMNT